MSNWITDPITATPEYDSADGGGLWWASSAVWQVALVLGLAVAGVLVNVVCALIWSGRPALRSHSTRYVYNMIASNLLTSAVLAPTDIAAVLLLPSGLRAGPWPWPGADPEQVEEEEEEAVATARLPLGSSWPPLLLLGNQFVQALAVQSSVMSTLLVAIDRHKAVLSPLHYARMATRQRSVLLILFCWTFSLVTTSFKVCLPVIPYYEWLYFSCGYAVPLVVIVYVYIKMSHAAHQNSKRTRRHSVCTSTAGQSGQQDSGGGSRGGSLDLTLPPFNTPEHLVPATPQPQPQPRGGNGRNPPLGSIVLNKRRHSNASFSTVLFREEGRAVKTALFVVVTFLACWTPYYLSLFGDFLPQSVVRIFAHGNPCLSPWIYVLRNEAARLEAKRLLLRLLHLPLRDAGGVRSDSYYSKSLEASGVQPLPTRQTSSHYDSMSVQSFHLPTEIRLFAQDEGCYGVMAAAQGGGHAAPHVREGGGDTPVTGDSFCNESPGTHRDGIARLGAYKYPHLQRGRSQTCIRQNSDSSSGSGRPLLRDTERNPQHHHRRRRVGSSGDSGSDQDTPHRSVPRQESLEDDLSPPPLTPNRRKFLHRDSLEEEDEGDLSPQEKDFFSCARRRLSMYEENSAIPPDTPPPRRSSLTTSSCRRAELLLDGVVFQFDNLPLDIEVPASLRQSSGGSSEQPDSDATGDSGICVASGPGQECIPMLVQIQSILRPPPPPRNKLKRIEAVEDPICDTTFTTHAAEAVEQLDEQSVTHWNEQHRLQSWDNDDDPMVHLSKGVPSHVCKVSDIKSIVKTRFCRPAFRIPKADF